MKRCIIILYVYLFTSCTSNPYKQTINILELPCAEYFRVKNYTDDPDVIFDDRETEIQTIIKRFFYPSRYHKDIDIRKEAEAIYRSIILSPNCHVFGENLLNGSVNAIIYPIQEPWPHTQISKLSGLILQPIEMIDSQSHKVVNKSIDLDRALKLKIVGTDKMIYYTIACGDTSSPFKKVELLQCKQDF